MCKFVAKVTKVLFGKELKEILAAKCGRPKLKIYPPMIDMRSFKSTNSNNSNNFGLESENIIKKQMNGDTIINKTE